MLKYSVNACDPNKLFCDFLTAGTKYRLVQCELSPLESLMQKASLRLFFQNVTDQHDNYMKIILLNHHERLSPRVALEAKTLKQMGHSLTLVNWCRNYNQTSELAVQFDGLPIRWIVVSSPKASLFLLRAIPKLITRSLPSV